MKGKQPCVPFKSNDSGYLDEYRRNKEKFDSVREIRSNSKFKDRSNGQKIRSGIACNEVEDVIESLLSNEEFIGCILGLINKSKVAKF